MARSKKSGDLDIYAISRLQSKRGEWWYWSVIFSRAGRVYYKNFYDVRRGGPEKALADAIAWRDEQLLAVKAMSMREFCQIKRTSNSSGTPGVQFVRTRIQPLGYWQARLKRPDGRTVAKTFAVKKYGEAQAFALAKAAREQLLEMVEDKPFLHHVDAKRFAALGDEEGGSGRLSGG